MSGSNRDEKSQVNESGTEKQEPTKTEENSAEKSSKAPSAAETAGVDQQDGGDTYDWGANYRERSSNLKKEIEEMRSTREELKAKWEGIKGLLLPVSRQRKRIHVLPELETLSSMDRKWLRSQKRSI
jgi:hypothetical protein